MRARNGKKFYKKIAPEEKATLILKSEEFENLPLVEEIRRGLRLSRRETLKLSAIPLSLLEQGWQKAVSSIKGRERVGQQGGTFIPIRDVFAWFFKICLDVCTKAGVAIAWRTFYAMCEAVGIDPHDYSAAKRPLTWSIYARQMVSVARAVWNGHDGYQNDYEKKRKEELQKARREQEALPVDDELKKIMEGFALHSGIS